MVFESGIFMGRIEVPRYSQPNEDGVKLDRDKRLSLAVARVIDEDVFEGMEYEVLTDIEGDFETVTYEQNPAFDGVWDPEKKS